MKKTVTQTGLLSSYLNLSAEKAAAQILEMVKPNAIASGIFPSVKAAQLILESNYIKSELAQNACNGFGMKKSLSGNTWPGSVWDGASVYTKETKEQKPDGTVYTTVADFRKYPSIADSIADHSAYLLGAKNGNTLRYVGLTFASNYKEQITIIKNGGYATDANYITKVCGIIEKFGLDKYDDEVGIEGLLDKLEEKTTLDRAYWRRVLTGEIPATSDYLFVLLERLAG